jgi:CubicO group peptidase (beta-lactamase class C family)
MHSLTPRRNLRRISFRWGCRSHISGTALVTSNSVNLYKNVNWNDSNLSRMLTTMIDGIYDPRFKGVQDALAQNLSDRNEIGEAVSVVINGKTVIDLWGGYKDRLRSQPWERDTLVCMFPSVSPSLFWPS